MDKFLTHFHSKDHSHLDEQQEIEALYEAILEDEINLHLNTRFNEE